MGMMVKIRGVRAADRFLSRVCLALGVLAAAGCAGALTVSRIQTMDRNADVDGLVDAWRTRPPASLQTALLDALAHHPDDARGRSVVIEAARRHPQADVRRRAVARLVAYDTDETTGVLLDALADPFPSVRAEAKATLTRRGTAVLDAVNAASRSHASPLVRSAALELLTQAGLREPSFRPTAVAALIEGGRRDDGPQVRAAAATGLGALNATSARPLLIALHRTDDDPLVRLQAGKALNKLDAPTGAERTVVAVLPLKNATGDPRLDGFGQQVADVVAAELSTAGVCEVVDEAKRDAAIAELKKMGSLLYDGDEPNAPELGRFALADQFAYGVVQRTGTTFTIVLHRMDVSTLKLLAGASVTVRGYREDLDRLKADAARKFVARFR